MWYGIYVAYLIWLLFLLINISISDADNITSHLKPNNDSDTQMRDNRLQVDTGYNSYHKIQYFSFLRIPIKHIRNSVQTYK